MIRRLLALITLTLMWSQAISAEWQIPPDNGTLEQSSIAAILSSNDYPETTAYRKRIDYIDFESHGQQFTQVVVTLIPDRPRLHLGRKLVVIGAEPGSEYAMDFLQTPEDKDGAGVWLAKRGVTFVALTRVGRWNFCKSRDWFLERNSTRNTHAHLQPQTKSALD